jgi:phosphoribosylaminoimidazole-succinocarboxamide synthase
MNLPLESFTEPFYVGSVQHLFPVPDRDDLMACQTGAVGSVFDVGALFVIDGNDISRAVFRHVLYASMAQPETWHRVRDAITSDDTLESGYKASLLEGILEECCVSGAKTHHVGMIDSVSGDVAEKGAPANPSTFNVVRRFQIVKPPQVRLFHQHLYDYSAYPAIDKNVIPLECIVRFGVTSGSSVYRAYQAMNDKERQNFQTELGVSQPLEAWQMLSAPIVDFTSKYEPEDRAVSKQEAMLMSGLSAEEFANVAKMSVLGAWVVRLLVESLGLKLWDLKWEFARDGKDLVFVDTIDTDSIRATGNVDGVVIHYNKQAMRDYYMLAQADWFAGVNAAKAEAKVSGASFVGILRVGQAAGKWSADPEIHAEFLAIQGEKVKLVTEGILGADVSAGLEDCGRREIAFYDGIGMGEALRKKNGC